MENNPTSASVENAARRKKDQKRNRTIAIAVLSVVLAVLAAILINQVFFVVSEVRVEGLDAPGISYSADEIIAASGIDTGAQIYSFEAEACREGLLSRFPALHDVEIRRKLPSTVIIAVTVEPPAFYLDLYGEAFSLTDTLRVTGMLSEEETESICKLKLAGLSEALIGYTVSFHDEAGAAFVSETVATVRASALAERITMLDLRNKYDVALVIDNRFRVAVGEAAGIDVKLRLVEKVLEDEMFSQNKTKYLLDVTSGKSCSVVADNMIEID